MIKKKSVGKKTGGGKKTAGKKTGSPKKTASKRSPARAKGAKSRRKPVSRRKTAARKPPARKGSAAASSKKARRRAAARRKPAVPARRGRRDADMNDLVPFDDEAPDPALGVLSGDTMGLSREELATSESVEELADEGQAFEAGIVDAVENAPNADRGPIRTREVPEDDVPEEYLDQDRDRS